jgi:hypothetical protein
MLPSRTLPELEWPAYGPSYTVTWTPSSSLAVSPPPQVNRTSTEPFPCAQPFPRCAAEVWDHVGDSMSEEHTPPANPRAATRGPWFWIATGVGVACVLCCAGGAIAFLIGARCVASNMPLGQDRDYPPAEAESRARGELRLVDQMLACIDEQRLDDAWARTDESLRAKTTRAAFDAAARDVRSRLGRLVSRDVTALRRGEFLYLGASTNLTLCAHFERGDATIDAVCASGTTGIALVDWRIVPAPR